MYPGLQQLTLPVKKPHAQQECRRITMPHKRPSSGNGALQESGQVSSKKKKLDESLFGEVLSDSGFILNLNNEPYTLETDQALFQRRLQKALRAHPVHCYPASVKEFLRGLDAHVSDNAQLKWALLYTQTASGCPAASRAGHQDSLLRLLLNIDELQVPIITLLVERLLEVAYNVSSDDDLSLPRLILANLQRLDRLTDPAAVSEKMLELLLGAPPEVQKDIITFLPEVVDDSTHPKVAEELCKLYYSSPELSVTILDALPGLSLSPEALLEVKHSVQKTVQAARPEHLPVVVKFLLEDAGRAEELIVDLRRRLRLPPPTEQGRSQPGPSQAGHHSASHEVALLHNVKFAFQVEKRQHMSWLKALDGVTPPDVHHPLDLLLLLQLHDTAPARQRLVEAVLKKKVRSRVFTREVLQLTFASHAQTLKQFISTLRRLAAFLLRCPEPALSGYGAEMYRLAFVSFSGYQQQEVVVGLLSHSADPPSVRLAALRLFQTLAEDNTDALARYSGFLKSWLDLLEQLTLPEARQLMEVLSTLAFRAPHEAATVGDELKLLIHKQLASSSNRYKRLGIISVLMAIKCRQNSGDSSSATTAISDDSQSSEIVLTTAGQRETVQLLQMAQTAVVATPAARGLLLDELGSLVWRAGIDPKIESWICDQQMDEFQETFVVDLPEGEPQCDGLKVALQYGLEEAAVGEIALNLAPLALHSPDKLGTLCAHFRLLRMCVASLDGGTMEKLDALLGCPVILPSETEPEAVSALPAAARHAVLTALFHCVNFFCELLNAFSTQKDQEMKRRCVRRLRAVQQLEAQIRQLLPLVPGFVPPAAIFDADTPPMPPSAPVKKLKPPPKRKGKGKSSAKAAAAADTTVNQTGVSQLEAATQADDRVEAAGAGKDLAGYRLFFRELDMDVYKLLYRRLSLTDHTSEEFCLRPSELLLLLEDLGLKLERRLPAAGGCGGLAALHATSPAATARGLGFSHLDLLPETSVARQAATLLKPLSVIADSIVTMFKSQIADNDGVMDGPGMFGEEATRLSACLAAVYRITATLLSWPGLTEADNRQLATEAVANLRLTDAGRSQLPPSQQAQHPAARAFALFEQHAAFVPHIECAANLARTLSALAELSAEPRLREALADCVETLLKREWFAGGGARETGAAYGGRVAALLRLHLAPDGGRLLERLDKLAQTGLTELLESTGREPTSETFPTLSKSTFGHYYRVMFAALVEAIRATVAATGSERSRLDRWATALRIFNQLVGCLRVFSSRSAVGLCLKHSRRLVDLFVRHAIPMMEQMLKHQRDEVLTILKNFQLSARYLHHVCNHSKNLKDASLMNHVPYLKKGLESFVFRVKAMLALNGCSDAFWMGNLKNRDLHGEEILSQQTDAGSGGEEDAEEDPEDGDESDVDLDAEEEHSSPDRPAADAAGDNQDSEISDAY